MAKKFTKEECDALLSVFNGKKNNLEIALKAKNIERLPSGTRKAISLPELVPVFQFIYESFCRSIQKKFSNEFKINIYFKSLSTDVIKFGEYKKSLEKDSFTFIFNTKELHCSVLIHVEDTLSSSLVNKSLGSNNDGQPLAEHSHSKIDEVIISKQVFIIAKELETAIDSAYEKIRLDFLKTENRPQLLSSFHPDDNVLLTVIEISSDSVNGSFHIAIPGIGLKLLQSKKS